MSRRKKQPHGRPKTRQQPLTEAQRAQSLIQDTLATFSCATQISHDFLHQCTDELESLECQLDYNRLALEMWGGHPGQVVELVATLSEYLAARERHQGALTTLHQRLTALVATPNHEHLEPAQWREAVSKRVLFEPMAT